MGLAILNRMFRKDLTEKLTFEETADGDEGVDRLIFGGRWFQAEGTASAKALRLGSGGIPALVDLLTPLIGHTRTAPKRKKIIE